MEEIYVNRNIKQVIGVRTDLKMSIGKINY